jgi:hypothetical protein
MKTTLLVTAALMLASAAHAAEPLCFAWVQKGENITCEMRGSSDSTGQADATYRDAQRRNNAGRSYQTTTTSVDADGKVSGTATTTTTFPRWR